MALACFTARRSDHQEALSSIGAGRVAYSGAGGGLGAANMSALESLDAYIDSFERTTARRSENQASAGGVSRKARSSSAGGRGCGASGRGRGRGRGMRPPSRQSTAAAVRPSAAAARGAPAAQRSASQPGPRGGRRQAVPRKSVQFAGDVSDDSLQDAGCSCGGHQSVPMSPYSRLMRAGYPAGSAATPSLLPKAYGTPAAQQSSPASTLTDASPPVAQAAAQRRRQAVLALRKEIARDCEDEAPVFIAMGRQDAFRQGVAASQVLQNAASVATAQAEGSGLSGASFFGAQVPSRSHRFSDSPSTLGSSSPDDAGSSDLLVRAARQAHASRVALSASSANVQRGARKAGSTPSRGHKSAKKGATPTKGSHKLSARGAAAATGTKSHGTPKVKAKSGSAHKRRTPRSKRKSNAARGRSKSKAATSSGASTPKTPSTDAAGATGHTIRVPTIQPVGSDEADDNSDSAERGSDYGSDRDSDQGSDYAAEGGGGKGRAGETPDSLEDLARAPLPRAASDTSNSGEDRRAAAVAALLDSSDLLRTPRRRGAPTGLSSTEMGDDGDYDAAGALLAADARDRAAAVLRAVNEEVEAAVSDVGGTAGPKGARELLQDIERLLETPEPPTPRPTPGGMTPTPSLMRRYGVGVNRSVGAAAAAGRQLDWAEERRPTERLDEVVEERTPSPLPVAQDADDGGRGQTERAHANAGSGPAAATAAPVDAAAKAASPHPPASLGASSSASPRSDASRTPKARRKRRSRRSRSRRRRRSRSRSSGSDAVSPPSRASTSGHTASPPARGESDTEMDKETSGKGQAHKERTGTGAAHGGDDSAAGVSDDVAMRAQFELFLQWMRSQGTGQAQQPPTTAPGDGESDPRSSDGHSGDGSAADDDDDAVVRSARRARRSILREDVTAGDETNASLASQFAPQGHRPEKVTFGERASALMSPVSRRTYGPGGDGASLASAHTGSMASAAAPEWHTTASEAREAREARPSPHRGQARLASPVRGPQHVLDARRAGHPPRSPSPRRASVDIDAYLRGLRRTLDAAPLTPRRRQQAVGLLAVLESQLSGTEVPVDAIAALVSPAADEPARATERDDRAAVSAAARVAPRAPAVTAATSVVVHPPQLPQPQPRPRVDLQAAASTAERLLSEASLTSKQVVEAQRAADAARGGARGRSPTRAQPRGLAVDERADRRPSSESPSRQPRVPVFLREELLGGEATPTTPPRREEAPQEVPGASPFAAALKTSLAHLKSLQTMVASPPPRRREVDDIDITHETSDAGVTHSGDTVGLSSTRRLSPRFNADVTEEDIARALRPADDEDTAA